MSRVRLVQGVGQRPYFGSTGNTGNIDSSVERCCEKITTQSYQGAVVTVLQQRQACVVASGKSFEGGSRYVRFEMSDYKAVAQPGLHP
jgi:hypothetical protein